MKAFLDTSAFAKRYLREPGSEEVRIVIDETDNLAVSVLCIPEFVSMLSRLVREGRLTGTGRTALKESAVRDLEDADVCQITPNVLGSAIVLLEKHTLPAIDALHIASAMATGADLFVSADRRQLAAARESRLRVADVS